MSLDHGPSMQMDFYASLKMPSDHAVCGMNWKVENVEGQVRTSPASPAAGSTGTPSDRRPRGVLPLSPAFLTLLLTQAGVLTYALLIDHDGNIHLDGVDDSELSASLITPKSFDPRVPSC